MKHLKKLCAATLILCFLTACGSPSTSSEASENETPANGAEALKTENENTNESKDIFDLLGETNGFTELANAQDLDSNGLENTVLAACGILIESFGSARLGTESAKAAVHLLVPENIYKDLPDSGAKLDAIYAYADQTLSSYFSLYVDNSGEVYDAEINLTNIQIFIEDCIAAGVFTGNASNWKLVEGTSLAQFAEKMGITEEVAFTMLYVLELYDASWIDGDDSSILEVMLEEQIAAETSAQSN